MAKYMKLQLFVDKFKSYPQFQPSFQHLTVKIGLKCLKPAFLLKTLLIMLKSCADKADITFCKLFFCFSTSIFLQNSIFVPIVKKSC